MKYIMTTTSTTVRKYLVEAESKEDVRRAFEDILDTDEIGELMDVDEPYGEELDSIREA